MTTKITGKNVVGVDYTPEPEVEGEILSCDGKEALVLSRLEDGDVHLLRYRWREDMRYSTRKGNWSCQFWVNIKLNERKVVADAIGK